MRPLLQEPGSHGVSGSAHGSGRAGEKLSAVAGASHLAVHFTGRTPTPVHLAPHPAHAPSPPTARAPPRKAAPGRVPVRVAAASARPARSLGKRRAIRARGAGRAGRALSAVHTPVQLSGARGASPVTAPVPGGKASALSASPPGTLPRGGSRAESPPPPLPPGGPGRPRWGEPG